MDCTVASFVDLHNCVQAYGDSASTTVVYRGVKSVDYKLVPKIGRLQGFRQPILDVSDEKLILGLFKQQALPYLDRVPANDWEWLAIGQHHGLPTRLLDWSRNPLVACFFAVEHEFAGDSVIYALKGAGQADPTTMQDPFEITGVERVIPSHVTARITAQAGLFTIHHDPRVPFESDRVDRLIIPGNARRELKKTLYKYGIHSATLFPGLEGLSRHIEWARTNAH